MATTALAAWQALAAALDDQGTYLVASSTSTAVTIGGLANSTTSASTRRYDGRYLANVSGTGTGQQRSVQPNSYVPSTGVVTITTGWNTTPSANDLVMLTGLFPVYEASTLAAGAGEDASYRQLVNRAISRILVEDRVSVSITTADSYNLASWDWLDRRTRVNWNAEGGWLKEPAPISGRRPISAMWRGPSLKVDGQNRVLELHAPFGTASGSLTLEVLRPANTWIATASNWAEVATSGGLINASDECLATLEEIRVVGMREACLALMSRGKNGRPSGNWAEAFAFWDGEARKLARYDHSLESAPAPVSAEAA